MNKIKVKLSIVIVANFFQLIGIIGQVGPQSERLERLLYGSIKPSGWLKLQMEKDMAGFTGNLDLLIPGLINDPIYGAERLHKQSKPKDLGVLKSGNTEGEEQYKWWNSETQSNWWDGYIRNALVLNDKTSIEKVKNYVDRIIATQDDDGYIGIYDKELRYKFTTENGELWSKSTLYRGLLAYYEYTHDLNVWNSLVRAVDNVMKNYSINNSQPFYSGRDYSGGVAHGLTFTDVLQRMHQLTGNKKYLDYAAFLYKNYSENYSSEKDAQLTNILDTTYKLKWHAVHSYEHLRPLLVAAYSTGNEELQKALHIYISRIRSVTTLTGGAIGDEWIGGRLPDATTTGYEYCSLQELLDSYTNLFQKEENPEIAELVETIFFNAAQGSRNPDHSSIAYLKTDNSYEMLGTRNGEKEQGRVQTRYKYSPVHQDVAVCCAPNAGRITPYFLQSSWYKKGEDILVAALLCPSILETTLKKNPVKIEEITDYPYNNKFIFKIFLDKSMSFQLRIRKPEWVKSILTSENYKLKNGFFVLEREFSVEDSVKLEFTTEVIIKEDQKHEKYFKYGALFYARQIPSSEQIGKIYATGFEDILYSPLDSTRFEFIENNMPSFKEGKIRVKLKNGTTQNIENIELVPFGSTILRQVSFK